MRGVAQCSAATLRATSFSPKTAARCSCLSDRHRMMGRGWANAMPPRSSVGKRSMVWGSAWGNETDRAAVLVFDPDGKNRRVFASGLRNCVGLAMHAQTGDLWCSTNERDGLGDDLVPDFITRVRDRAFYGWPWYYLGANEDPRHRGERPDLKDKITLPDVLIQAHSASMGMVIYDGDQFPSEYRGDAFAAQHGSWNRAKRTGYKVIRARLNDGIPTGEY